MDWFTQTVPVKRVTLIGLMVIDVIFLAVNAVKTIKWAKALPSKIQERRVERKYSTMTVDPQISE